MNDYLRPTAICEVPYVVCGWAETYRTYQQAKWAARDHFKETGHPTRAEQIRTHLFLEEVARDS